MPNTPIFASFALLLGAAALGACSEAPAEQAASREVTGAKVSNARMVLSPVSGNPAAVYFDLEYAGDRPITLRGASVKGAESAMMHTYGAWEGRQQMMEMTPLVINAGDKVTFAPGGQHIMAMKPAADLMPGGSTEVTLTVVGDKTFSFPAEIRGANDER